MRRCEDGSSRFRGNDSVGGLAACEEPAASASRLLVPRAQTGFGTDGCVLPDKAACLALRFDAA
eukprot:scaffold121119_cov28-Tisochrysis_lutea.AAC.5